MNRRKFLPLVALVLTLCVVLLWMADTATSIHEPDPLTLASPYQTDGADETLAKIEPQVLRELTGPQFERDTVPSSEPRQTTFIVHLRERADLADLRIPEIQGQERLAPLRPAEGAALRLARRRAAIASLQDTANRSQSALRAYLDGQLATGHVSRVTPFWIFNGLAVTGDLETLLALAARPEVEKIRANHIRYIDDKGTRWQEPVLNGVKDDKVIESPDVSLSPGHLVTLSSIEWNLSLIGADRVWQEFGVTGQGVVVANMDTGVDWTHPALQAQYRGISGHHVDHNYHWYDFTRTYPGAPADGHSHGTHTMGIAVGSDEGLHQIGVAPAARWIAVKVFNDAGSAEDVNIHAGFQWLLAPTDLNGKNPDPARAPDVVNNSWGIAFDGANPEFWDDVQALRAAGIVPVFAAGNDGSLGTGSVEAPASYPHSLAVGATNDQDNLASFSGRGPSFWEQIKPDLTAPGVNIRSSVPPPEFYRTANGTSMAAPHVTGLIALLLQANPALQVDDIVEFLRHTAIDRGEPGRDNLYGAGRIDAYTAVRWALNAGKLYGLVRDAASGQGVPGATVTGLRRGFPGDKFTLQSDPRGQYAISVPAGWYDVTATAPGYQTATIAAVQVYTGFLSVRDFRLTRLPLRHVTGRVTEAGTGQALSATIAVVGMNISTTTETSGAYTLPLPPGAYTLQASAPRHRSVTAHVNVTAELQTQDFVLSPAPSILLVDADAGVGAPVSAYYRWALDYLHYPYTVYALPERAITADLPRLTDYEVVIWAHNSRAPSQAGAQEVLRTYLDAGGRLLLSGSDIGQIDFETNLFRNWLHASFVTTDSASRNVTGVPGDIFDGLRLNLVDVYGYKDPNLAPDAVEPAPSDSAASAVLQYANGLTAGLKADVCRVTGGAAYRVVYLPFGFEYAGPRPDQAMMLDRAIQWLASQRPRRGVGITPASGQASTVAGGRVNFTRQVVNQGESPDTFSLALSGPWPARIIDTRTGQPVTRTPMLNPCAAQTVRIEIDIPPTAAIGAANITLFQAISETDNRIKAEATFSTRAFPTWQLEQAVPVAASRAAAAGIDCTVYRIGGEGTDGGPLADVYAYDPANRQWSSRRSKPTPVSNVTAAVLNGKVYVPGGYNNGPTAVVEAYDPATDTWQSVAPLPEPLWGSAAAVVGGKLYVMGGTQDGSVNQAKTFAFDPQSGTWTRKADMQVPRVHLAAATLDGLIYAVGGRTEAGVDLDTVEVYDPVKNTWSSKKPLPTPRSGLGAAALGEFLYVAGGGWYSYLPVVERYNPVTDDWESITSLQVGRRSLGLAVAGGRLYAISGFDGDYRPTVESLTLAPNVCAATKTAFPALARPGDVVTYTITLPNPGPGTLTNVRLTDPIPPLTTFVPGSATAGASYNSVLNRIEWVGDVPPFPPLSGGGQGGVDPGQGTFSITFQVRLNQNLIGGTPILNTATIEDGQGTWLTRSAEIRTLGPNLTSSFKTVDPALAVAGDVLTYTIVLRNQNPATATHASLLDPIPAHTTYVPGSAEGGAVYNGTMQRIEWQGDLPNTEPTQYRLSRSDASNGPLYNWTEIGGSGTKLLLGDDDRAEIPLPFRFNFYGEEYSRLFVNSNGVLFFDDAYLSFNNKCIPGETGSGVRGLIAPFWDDLNPGDPAAGGVYYAIQGTAPNRRLVVEWYRVPRFMAGTLTFEVILYEATGEIVFQYQDVMVGNAKYDLGQNATVGIQRDTMEGLQFSCNTPSLADGLALRFAPPFVAPILSYRVRLDHDLPLNTLITNTARIDDGSGIIFTTTVTTPVNVTDISTSRLLVDQTQAPPGGLLTYRLLLANTGNADLPNLQVSAPLPALTTYVPNSATGGAIYDQDNRRITWQGLLRSGITTELSFQARLHQPLPGGTIVVNTATLQDSQGTTLTRSVTTTVLAPDLSQSEKLVNVAQVAVGTPVTYTVRIRNTGAISTQVSLADRLPPELTYVSNSAWAGSGEAVQYDAASQTLSWRGELPPRAVTEISFRAVPRKSGEILNSVRLDDGAGTFVDKTAQLMVVARTLSRLFIPLVARN